MEATTSVLQIRLTKKQTEAWAKLTDHITKYILFGGAAAGGKTFLGVTWLLSNCIAYPGTRWFVGRERLKDIKSTTLQSLYKACRHYEIDSRQWFRYNAHESYIQFFNGSRIDLLELKFYPSDPFYERMGSLEFDGGFIDEGCQEAAFEILKSRIGRNMVSVYNLFPKILITANPKRNWLYKEFWKPYSSGTLPETHAFIKSTVEDNPFNDPVVIENLRDIKNITKRQRLLLGIWDYEDEQGGLIEYGALEDMFSGLVGEQVQPGKRYITADVARFGKDKTVIMVWSGYRMEKVVTLGSSSVPETNEAIKDLAERFGVRLHNILVDEDGIGGGVVDLLQCQGFVNNSKPINRKRKTFPTSRANVIII